MTELEKLNKTCLNCTLANWNKTKAGRLHPDGSGRCGWKMPEIALPASFYFIGAGERRRFPEPSGGFIDRKTPKENCPTWEPAK